MDCLTTHAKLVLLLALLVCAVLLPMRLHNDEDLLVSSTGFHLADHAQCLKAISRNEGEIVLPVEGNGNAAAAAPLVNAAPTVENSPALADDRLAVAVADRISAPLRS